MSNEENTGTDGRLVLEFTTEVIAESERCKQDIANAYRVYENPNAAGGVIIYGLYHGKWCANVSGRSVVKYLLAANAELKEKLALTRCELSYLKAGKTMAVQILHRHGGMVLVTTEELRSMITQIAEYEVIWDPEEGERIAEVRRQLENMLKGSH